MPVAPSYERRVTPRPANQAELRVRATPDAFGASIGRGLKSVAAGLADAGSAFDARDELRAKTEARERRNSYMTESRNILYDPNDGFLTLTGKNALDRRKEVDERLLALRSKHGEGLNPRAARLYNESVDSVEQASLNATIRHDGEALKQYTAEQSENSILNFQEEALLNYGDETAFKKYLAAAALEQREIAGLQGWSPERLDKAERDLISNTYKRAAIRIAETDPLAAHAYIEKNKGQLNAQDQHELNTGLDNAVKDAQALRETTRILQTSIGADDATGGPSARYAAITKQKESGGRNIKASTSSAFGHYQITEGTWEAIIRAHPEAGLTSADRYDPAKQEIGFNLFTQDNAKALQAAGVPVNDKTLYMAHFLGRAGGPRFIKAMARTPNDPAINHVSDDQAQANRAVFFNKDGSPRTVAEVFARQTSQYDDGGSVLTVSRIEEELNKISDPEVRDRTRKRLYAALEAQSKSRTETAKAAQQDMWEDHLRNGTDVSDMPIDLQIAAGPSGMTTLRSAIEAEKTDDGTRDDGVLYELSRMAAESPEKFKDVNLLEYRPQLDKASFDELRKSQASIVSDLTKAKQEGLKISSAMDQANTQLRAAGVVKKDMEEEDYQRLARFQNALVRRMQRFQEDKGVAPTPQDTQELINQLLLQAVFTKPGDYWGEAWHDTRDGFLFEAPFRATGESVKLQVKIEDIPIDLREEIAKVIFEDTGRQPTEEQIVDEYLRFILDE